MQNPDIRQTNYIIVVHQTDDRQAFENTIDESTAYVEKFPERKAVIFSSKYRNDDLKKIPYNQVQTFKRGELRMVDQRDKTEPEAAQIITEFLRNGLAVFDHVQVAPETIYNVLNRPERGIDLIIHRNSIDLYDFELEFINQQIQFANQSVKENRPYRLPVAVYFRIHFSDKFKFNRDELVAYMNKYGQETGYLFFLCNYILLKSRIEYRKLLEKECLEQGEKFETYIDPFHFRRESSNFIYFDLISQKIVGASEPFIEKCGNEIIEHLKING